VTHEVCDDKINNNNVKARNRNQKAKNNQGQEVIMRKQKVMVQGNN
jgi:hypothetical protein